MWLIGCKIECGLQGVSAYFSSGYLHGVPDRATVVQRKLAQAIRVARDARNMSQLQLAENSNLSLNFIGRVERSEQMASIASVIQIAEALGMSGEELLGKAKL